MVGVNVHSDGILPEPVDSVATSLLLESYERTHNQFASHVILYVRLALTLILSTVAQQFGLFTTHDELPSHPLPRIKPGNIFEVVPPPVEDSV